MSLPHPIERPANSVCPRCGAALRCGNIAGDAQCWCAQLPNIMPVPPAPGALSKNSQKTTADDAGSDAAIRPPTALPAPGETPSAASCLCPACLKQITDVSIHAPSEANLDALNALPKIPSS